LHAERTHPRVRRTTAPAAYLGHTPMEGPPDFLPAMVQMKARALMEMKVQLSRLPVVEVRGFLWTT